MAFGILTIMAGAAYILWQCHKEYKGTISAVLFSCLVFVGPLALIPLFMAINDTLGIIYGFIVLFVAIGGGIYLIANNGRFMKESVTESIEIWNEVDKLEIPDAATLRQYKLANSIPVYPEDNKTYNDAAINAWRRDEYNKRMKERHWITF